MHQQLDALLLTPWQAIEATPGLQIDHGFQPLVTLEREAGTQAGRFRLNTVPDRIGGCDLLHQQLAKIEGTFDEEDGEIEDDE